MQPLQPLYVDERGTVRFKENAIVRFLLDNGPFDMNDISRRDFSQEDREQFAQLIGYTLNGFSELSYVSDETFNVAQKSLSHVDERDARISVLENTLAEIRSSLKDAAVAAFRIHPDDLKV